MKISKIRNTMWALFMAFLMSNISNVALANKLISSKNEMISTSVALAEITRVEAEKDILDYFQKSEVQNELIKQGVSPNEVTTRLANLSEQEIQQLSGQVKEARAGGDILVAVLLVVLIIYFIKRI